LLQPVWQGTTNALIAAKIRRIQIEIGHVNHFWQMLGETCLQLFLIQFDATNGLVRSPYLTAGSHGCE
jgi:hypothetical protein